MDEAEDELLGSVGSVQKDLGGTNRAQFLFEKQLQEVCCFDGRAIGNDQMASKCRSRTEPIPLRDVQLD